jgi:hypothetical protein
MCVTYIGVGPKNTSRTMGSDPKLRLFPKCGLLKYNASTDTDNTPNIKHEGKDQYGRVTITERSLNVHTV